MTSITVAQNESNCYRLERYYFYPEKKLVEINEYFEEDTYHEHDGEMQRLHAFGYRNQSAGINYDSTTIYFMGGTMLFEENLKHQEIPSPNDKLLMQDLSGNFAYLTKDKDSTFLVYTSYNLKKFNITDMKPISKYLYQNNDGKFYALAGNTFTEIVGQENFPEMSSLTYIAHNYYSGKDGLYWIFVGPGWKHAKTVKLADGNRQTDKIKAAPYYIVYNNNVYPMQSSDKIDLNPARIKAINWGKRFGYPILTDGVKTYQENREIENLAEGIPHIISEWRSFQRKGDTLFWGCKKIPDAIDVKFPIFASENGEIELHPAYKTLMMYNHKIKDYEPFEKDKYRFVSGDFYTYKGILYGKDSYPIYEQDKINPEKLTFVERYIRTNFYQDGNVLIYIKADFDGFVTKEYNISDNGELILGNDIAEGVDFNSLKIGTENIMIDKNNIYSGTEQGLTIIPLKKLGIKVKAFAD